MTTVQGQSFSLRAASNDDLEDVFKVVASSDMREFGEADMSYEEFAADWAKFDHHNNLQVAVDNTGQLVGYASCTADGEFNGVSAEGYVHADFEGRGIGTALIGWTERRAADFVALAPEGTRVVLQNPTNAYNAEAKELFTALGYRLERQFWRMQIVFNGPPRSGDDLDGIVIRAARTNDHERQIWSVCQEAFAEHWGTTPLSFEAWSKRRMQYDHDAGLWWMAFAGDTLVGVLVGKVLPGSGGWIQDVGVLKDWRRRGIASALVERSLGSFYERGIPSVALGVDTANATGATQVYERAGMSIVRGFSIWEKMLRDGVLVVTPVEDE